MSSRNIPDDSVILSFPSFPVNFFDSEISCLFLQDLLEFREELDLRRLGVCELGAWS
jgi:hypothetical protein